LNTIDFGDEQIFEPATALAIDPSDVLFGVYRDADAGRDILIQLSTALDRSASESEAVNQPGETDDDLSEATTGDVLGADGQLYTSFQSVFDNNRLFNQIYAGEGPSP